MDSLEHFVNALVVSAVRDAVGPAVETALTAALPDIVRRAALPVYLTRAEVCDLTGWSPRHLSYLQAQRRIPYFKRGRTVVFKTADIEAYLDAGRIEAFVNEARDGAHIA